MQGIKTFHLFLYLVFFKIKILKNLYNKVQFKA